MNPDTIAGTILILLAVTGTCLIIWSSGRNSKLTRNVYYLQGYRDGLVRAEEIIRKYDA